MVDPMDFVVIRSAARIAAGLSPQAARSWLKCGEQMLRWPGNRLSAVAVTPATRSPRAYGSADCLARSRPWTLYGHNSRDMKRYSNDNRLSG
jgi:hypothetical protein